MSRSIPRATTSVLRRVREALVATAVAASLLTAGIAGAREPEAAVSPADATDELNPQAEEHVRKALTAFGRGAYGDAEQEFKRAAFFTPNWRPLHFNLGVVAEAQGKIGLAVREYQSFMPLAVADEGLVAEQRIAELNDRKRNIAKAYRRQIILASTAMTLGLAGIGGGVGVLVVNKQREKEAEAEAEAMSTPEMPVTSDYDGSKLKIYAYVLFVYGALVVGYSLLPLSKAIKSRRQLDGIALGPTRLHLVGRGGPMLRF